jgi:hypothetical protein
MRTFATCRVVFSDTQARNGCLGRTWLGRIEDVKVVKQTDLLKPQLPVAPLIRTYALGRELTRGQLRSRPCSPRSWTRVSAISHNRRGWSIAEWNVPGEMTPHRRADTEDGRTDERERRTDRMSTFAFLPIARVFRVVGCAFLHADSEARPQPYTRMQRASKARMKLNRAIGGRKSGGGSSTALVDVILAAKTPAIIHCD